MAQNITASVGRAGGANFPNDVKVVQQLLNNVPENAGGPHVKLQVDGVCGPMTKDAIQKFQVRQFGWGGADGRVDPNGRTLAKLNEFDSGVPVPPPFPALTTASVLLCPHGGAVSCIPTGMPPFGPISGGGVPLKATDPCVVAGCTFPTPCVRVQWISPSPMLDIRSVGLCMNAANFPQGPVVIAKA
jgi:hypothetical protein